MLLCESKECGDDLRVRVNLVARDNGGNVLTAVAQLW